MLILAAFQSFFYFYNHKRCMRKRNLVVTVFLLLAFAGCKDTANETNSVLGYLHSFLLNGTATLNGNTLTLPGRASVYTTPFLITSTESNNNYELYAYYRSF